MFVVVYIGGMIETYEIVWWHILKGSYHIWIVKVADLNKYCLYATDYVK